MRNDTSNKRNLRLEEEITRILGEAVSGLLHSEPPEESLRHITITRVSLSPDRKLARIFFSSYLAGMAPEDAKSVLEEHSSWLRKMLSSKLRSIRTPKLTFEYDTEIDRTNRLGELFEQIRSERGE